MVIPLRDACVDNHSSYTLSKGMCMTILIIDDEPDLLECVVDSVQSIFDDITVLSATSVGEAKLKIQDANIVLSDINMPNRDQLEDMLKTCNLPVGRITGHDTLKSNLVVYKPYTDESLTKVIKLLVDMSGKK
jgi:DNA-binding NtrC family response regulator